MKHFARIMGLILLLMAAASIVAVGIVTANATRAEASSIREKCEAPGITNRFDIYFRIATRKYLPSGYGHQWCLLKALAWTESSLNPHATSPVGAIGLLQVMPATAKETARRHQIMGNVRDARTNINIAAAHIGVLIGFWSAQRSQWCRVELVIASYNAGQGNIAKAQVLSGGKRCWNGIAPALPQVTGRHANETIGHVSRTMRHIIELKS